MHAQILHVPGKGPQGAGERGWLPFCPRDRVQFPASECNIRMHAASPRSGGGHFVVNIVSNAFEGKNSIERHRMIYQALGDAMKSEIHALSINARTEKEV